MDLRQIGAVALFIVSGFAVGCGAASSPGTAPPTTVEEPNPLTIPLRGLDHGKSSVAAESEGARFVVVEFFSHHCPCQAAHDKRIQALYDAYHSRGVSFVLVDSEEGATVERDRQEAEKRGYVFPLLLDSGAALATRLGAEFATHAVILDRSSGKILYRGGIDSDHSHLTEDATPFVKNALDDLLAQKPVRKTDTKPLGCVLHR